MFPSTQTNNTDGFVRDRTVRSRTLLSADYSTKKLRKTKSNGAKTLWGLAARTRGLLVGKLGTKTARGEMDDLRDIFRHHRT